MNLESEIIVKQSGYPGPSGCGRSTQNDLAPLSRSPWRWVDPLLPPCVSSTHQESYKIPGLNPSIRPLPSDHALSCWLLTPLYLVDDRISRNSELLLIWLWYLAFGSTLKKILTQVGENLSGFLQGYQLSEALRLPTKPGPEDYIKQRARWQKKKTI